MGSTPQIIPASSSSQRVLGATLTVQTPAEPALTGARADDLKRINAARHAHGLPALKADPALNRWAQTWAQHMADVGRLAHSLPLQTYLHKYTHRQWLRLGQNCAEDGSEPLAFRAFMHSPGHRANILDRSFRSVGIGVVTDAQGQVWVCQCFARFASKKTSHRP